MKRNQIPLLALFCLFAGTSFSQNIAPSWTAYYQGTGDNSDRFNKIIPDGTGNFIGVGYTIKPGNYRDFLTVKFNSNGDTLWWRAKNGKNSKEDEALTVDIDGAGNIYVAGYSDAGLTEDDIMIIKYDANGVAQWDTLWNSPYSMNDAPVELHVDIHNNIYIAGNAKPDTAAGNRDIVILKYFPDGGLDASYIYTNQSVVGGKDEAAGMDIGFDGNIYVTGRSYNGISDDYITLKFHADTLGMPMWIRTFDGGNNDRANDIAIDNDGAIIITGQSSNGNDYDFRTIKYDSTGIFLWTKFYNAPASEDDIALFIGIDAGNNIVIGGETDVDQTFATNMDYQVVKYNSVGTLQWAVRTGNNVQQDDHPNALAVDGNGNIFLTGRSDQNNAPLVSDEDFMTIMYNPSGSLQWGGPLYYAGTRTGDDDIASSILVDGSYIIVAGGAENIGTHKDATIIKYEIASGTMVWDKNYNGEGDFNESAKAIVVDLNNFSYAAGYAFTEKHNMDACISKIDPTGNVICTYKYQGIKGDDDEFEKIAISVNGIIYATGYTRVTDQKRNLLLVKWDPSTCDTVWTRTYDYGIAQGDRGESLVVDVMGNVYVTGRSDANPVDSSDNNDIITMKFDTNGNMQWLQRYNGTGNLKDEPVKIMFDNNGDLLVGGQTENVHDDDFIVLKYNTAGTLATGFPVIYGGPFSNDDRVTDIAVDAANNIFVAGYMQTMSGNAPQDPVVVKYDAAGNYLSAYFSFGNDKDEPTRIAIDSQNNVYVLYKFDADGLQDTAANYDFLLKKLNNTLDTIYYEKQYDSPIHGDDLPADMFIGPSGDVYITGSSENDSSASRINKNWVTIGYDDSGFQIFISNWDGPNATDDSPNALTIRGSMLWVAGNAEGTSNNQKDLTVNNYDLFNVSVNEINKSSKAVVFPNPFNDRCEILLNDDAGISNATLEVFDMLGNSVVLPQLFSGRSVKFSRGNLAPGIYEYRIKNSSNILANGKLIIN